MRNFIIHAHFYQPLRENPYLGEVPVEESAYPFENWNERIYRECYLPVAYAHYREDGITKEVINAYKHLSFNMGWTLLSWIEKHHPELIEKIREGAKHALATSFNHTILPLDPPEDREVQILWGIRAYEKFFGRKPRGFWLPELAADDLTLELLKKHGIEFIVLAPHQVSGKGSYLRVNDLSVFVYNGELSHGVSFGELLYDAERLWSMFKESEHPAIIATDGETFGHHKKFGEFALAYLFRKHSKDFTTLEDYHRAHKPVEEGKLIPNTSWSCPHGVERWRSDCGCSVGGLPGWHQKWRKPLRKGLEAVRLMVKEKAYSVLERYLKDPEQAVLDYVDVLTENHSERAKRSYLRRHSKRKLSSEERVQVFKALSSVMHINFAFSSDGWFFADISGIETVNNLLHAKRAIELAGAKEAEGILKEYLAEAPSNLIEYGNGLRVWELLVEPKAYSPNVLAQTAVFLYLSEGKKDRFGSWSYKVKEEKESFLVFLKNTRTEEEFSFELGWSDLDLEKLPPNYLKLVLQDWVSSFEEGYLNFTSDYVHLLEEINLYAKAKPFEFLKDARNHLELVLRLRLRRALESAGSAKAVEDILKEAERHQLDLRIHELRQYFISFCLRKLTEEEELLKAVELIKEHNSKVGKFEFMIDLWEVQNAVWERRESIKDKRLLRMLNLQPDATE
ncbi:DUF3536 domain-containing protein [Thermocrinis sp.]